MDFKQNTNLHNVDISAWDVFSLQNFVPTLYFTCIISLVIGRNALKTAKIVYGTSRLMFSYKTTRPLGQQPAVGDSWVNCLTTPTWVAPSLNLCFVCLRSACLEVSQNEPSLEAV